MHSFPLGKEVSFAGTPTVNLKCFLNILIFVIAFRIESCTGHGRLIEPPSRASAWRYGFATPPDYNDHEMYCGGFTRQWKRNGGKCGECGDAWDSPEPRAHEYGGQWGQGVIVRKYNPGADMTIRVELTASHMGYFEFRLCPDPSGKQDCLDRNVLKILGGSPAQPATNDLETRFYPRNGSRIYEIKAQLPDLKCGQCLLQWRYIAGNNWGMCPDGNGAVGCGPQEEFRACADISLGEGAHTPIRPPRPTQRTTLRPQTTATGTESTQDAKSSDSFSYTPIIITIILLILVLCFFGIWFLYRSNNQSVKTWMEFAGAQICKKQKNLAAYPTKTQSGANVGVAVVSPTLRTASEKEPICDAPVPPPRVKRQARVKEMSPHESSIA